MNFVEEFKKGQEGGNKGLYMGEGLHKISSAINGVQRSRLYGLAAAPKAGKSTTTDYGFVINPLLDAIKQNIPIEFIYFSFEIDRVSKEFDFCAYFLFLDYGIKRVELEEGCTHDGESIIDLTPDYLRGRLQDDKGNTIKVKDKIKDKIKEVYENRIVPLFGRYDKNGLRTRKGYITFIEEKNNPTGIYKYLLRHAGKFGKFINIAAGENKTRIIGYKPSDPEKITICIFDHLRKLIKERGFSLKETVDKMIEYQVEIKNWTGYSFVDIIHTNRDMSNQDRIRFAKDLLHPTSDDIKDTGNLAEDADYLFTIMNPNDDRYNLKKHFGLEIKDSKNNLIYPGLTTFHLVESRHCRYPQHFRTIMEGAIKNFTKFVK